MSNHAAHLRKRLLERGFIKCVPLFRLLRHFFNLAAQLMHRILQRPQNIGAAGDVFFKGNFCHLSLPLVDVPPTERPRKNGHRENQWPLIHVV